MKQVVSQVIKTLTDKEFWAMVVVSIVTTVLMISYIIFIGIPLSS